MTTRSKLDLNALATIVLYKGSERYLMVCADVTEAKVAAAKMIACNEVKKGSVNIYDDGMLYEWTELFTHKGRTFENHRTARIVATPMGSLVGEMR